MANITNKQTNYIIPVIHNDETTIDVNIESFRIITFKDYNITKRFINLILEIRNIVVLQQIIFYSRLIHSLSLMTKGSKKTDSHTFKEDT